MRPFLLSLCLAGIIVSPLLAAEKLGMPDLGQEEQTCLPTSTANLIVWFGLHGYPKLIVKGDSAEDGYIHTVHALMTATNATYQLGTQTEAITYGIENYIRDAGYSADVEYRGLDWSQAKFPEIIKDEDEEKYKKNYKKPAAFTQDWLLENDNPQKGFILLLAYTNLNFNTSVFTDAINAGHAVTLVNAEPDMILIHDPAHYPDMPGRKILSPQALTGGTFQLPGYDAPVSGLLLLTSDVMWKPRGSEILLTGAVCITMHPDKDDTSIVKNAASSPSGMIGGASGASNHTPSSAPATTPAGPAGSSNQTWAMWLFDFFFKK